MLNQIYAHSFTMLAKLKFSPYPILWKQITKKCYFEITLLVTNRYTKSSFLLCELYFDYFIVLFFKALIILFFLCFNLRIMDKLSI